MTPPRYVEAPKMTLVPGEQSGAPEDHSGSVSIIFAESRVLHTLKTLLYRFAPSEPDTGLLCH